MEQTRYWMWAKRRHGGLSSHHQPSATAAAAAAYDESSWEEQAFAEDAAGSLGGCVWPPRSYSCSFCGREFRSAQALGGHMNVHRRDRARLKQSPTPPGHDNHHHQNTTDHHHHHPFLPLGLHQYQTHDDHHDELCNNFVYNPNPNPNLPSTPPSSKDKCHEKALFPTFTSPFVDDLHPKAKPTKSPSSPKSWSNMVVRRRNTEGEIRSSPRILDYLHTKTDLSVSLNLVVLPTTSSSNMISKEEISASTVVGCKRKRSSSDDDHQTLLPFFLKPISMIDRHLQPVDELSPSSSVDDIDLELRLGDRPKVK